MLLFRYEEEILRLRRELEARGGQLPPTAVGAVGNVEKRSYGPLPGAPLSGPVPPGPSHIPPPQFNHSRPPQPVSVPNPDHQLGAQPKLSIRTTSSQAPQGQAAPATQKTIQLFGNVDPETITPTFKHEGPDWIAWFNPKIPRTLDVNLSQDLEHPSVVCCVKYSADGKYLATGCNKVTHVYDATDGSKIATLIDDSAPEDGDLYIRSICFSPDGRFLATGAEDKQIRVMNVSVCSLV
jgi:glucose repression regulatory protein TUP1